MKQTPYLGQLGALRAFRPHIKRGGSSLILYALVLLLGVAAIVNLRIYRIPMFAWTVVSGFAENKTRPIQRIFVVGCGHSGTSVLARTISHLPSVYCIPQESYIFGFENKEVASRPLETAIKQMDEWDAKAASGGFSAWVEKSPAHVYYIEEILKSNPDNAKIIFIHRDGRDTVLSLLKRGFGWEKAVRRWVDDNEAALPHLGDSRLLKVGFEDMMNKDTVMDVLQKIAEFLQLDVSDESLALALLSWGKGLNRRARPVFCAQYRNDLEKYSDLAQSLIQLLGEGEMEWIPPTFGVGLRRHHKLRDWQLSRPWVQISSRWNETLSEAQKTSFNNNEKAASIMETLGYTMYP